MVRITKLKLHRTISDIMKKGNLDTLTTKKIRQLCEQKYNMDLTDRKTEIDKIVLAFVKEKSKEEEDEEENHQNNAQNNANDEHSSDESNSPDGSADEGSDEDEGESSCSGSESCSNSECSSSESSDNESNKQVPAKSIPAKTTSNVAFSANQAIASTSKESTAVASTSKQSPAIASTSKQIPAVASTSKQSPANVASNAVPAKRPMKNITAPPKKRMTSQSMMNTADDDVAAIAAAAAIVPSKKPKSTDLNNKVNAPAAVVPPKKSSSANNISTNNNVTASSKAEMDDAAYARQLQAEEWNFRRGTINKLFRNTSQKKTNKNDQKKKKACPFLKKCLLSPALAEVLGTNEMSRPDVVQKMWSVVRERNLFDPSNKQFILCDEQLANIFGKKRIRLIGMMKHLKKHIKDVN